MERQPRMSGTQGLKVSTHVVARNPCPTHNFTHFPEGKRLPDGSVLVDEFADCQGGFIGESDGDAGINALAQLTQINILALSGQSVKTVSNVSQAISVADVPSAPTVVAGTTGTAPAFTDYALGDGTTNTDYHTNSAYCQAGTVNAIASNHFTVTGTITNNSAGAITYKEIGQAVTVTHSATAYYFLLAHDQVNAGTGYLVSINGTLAITYTYTYT